MRRVPDDLVVCAYALCEDDFSEVGNYVDCIPEALYVLQDIAIQLGVKIRFSTVSTLIDHVVEINKFKEREIEQIMNNLYRMLTEEDTKKASLSLLKTLLRKEINIALKEQDLNEIAIAALYASFIKTLNHVQGPPLPIETQVVETETITSMT
jgi:hypothetical protein